MANKAMLMKMMQESRGYEQITNRRPTPRPIVLYLMQLRAQHTHSHAPKQRLTIATEWAEQMHIPTPVTIKHLGAGDSELPIVFG